MSNTKLKLNPDKTEFVILVSKTQRDKLKSHFPVHILPNPLNFSESVKNLGVWFDSEFSFTKHIQSVCKNFVQLRVQAC